MAAALFSRAVAQEGMLGWGQWGKEQERFSPHFFPCNAKGLMLNFTEVGGGGNLPPQLPRFDRQCSRRRSPRLSVRAAASLGRLRRRAVRARRDLLSIGQTASQGRREEILIENEICRAAAKYFSHSSVLYESQFGFVLWGSNVVGVKYTFVT